MRFASSDSCSESVPLIITGVRRCLTNAIKATLIPCALPNMNDEVFLIFCLNAQQCAHTTRFFCHCIAFDLTPQETHNIACPCIVAQKIVQALDTSGNESSSSSVIVLSLYRIKSENAFVYGALANITPLHIPLPLIEIVRIYCRRKILDDFWSCPAYTLC